MQRNGRKTSFEKLRRSKVPTYVNPIVNVDQEQLDIMYILLMNRH